MNNEEIISLPVEQAEYSVIDVETTGLSRLYNNIIEIGIVRISGMKITGRFHSLVNPGRNVPYYISALTGITNDDVYNAPFFEEIADAVSEFISGSVIAGHNLSFDSGFLKKEFSVCGKEEPLTLNLCTKRLSKRFYPMLKSKSLSSICRHLNLVNHNPHRALPDAEITARVLIKMIQEAGHSHKIKFVGELLSFQNQPFTLSRTIKLRKKLAEDISLLPDAPGIYYFLGKKGEIIYIGKAKSLMKRVRSYLLTTAPRKAKKIVRQAYRLRAEIKNSELTALLSEAESIKTQNPKMNTFLRRYGNKYFLRITNSESAPRLEVCNFFDFDGNDYFGLFVTKKKAIAVYELINRAFALRECDDHEFSKKRKCFLAEIERCLAPCVNSGSGSYKEELERVYEFLYGKNQFALNRLLNKMKYYSEKQKYEKAAEVKETIDLILSQTHKSSLLAEPVNSANVLFEISEAFGKDYVLLLNGKIYVKNFKTTSETFEEALDDYFDGTIHLNNIPGDEDLEKMKITLNWLIVNRNKTKIYYMKNYHSKEELFKLMTPSSFNYTEPQPSLFDIKHFTNEEFSDI